jgi:transposase
VDSSSIEVNRRQRRAKSDGLDVRKLVSMLIRYAHGERAVWRVVPVPSVAAEDQRHLAPGPGNAEAGTREDDNPPQGLAQ